MQLESEIQKLEKPMRPAVVCYLIDGDRVLLGLRKRVSLGLGANLISGIGGKIEVDPEAFENGEVIFLETAEEALIRELQEEISVTPTEFTEVGRIRFVFPANPKWNQDVKAYLCTNWTGEPAESEEIAPEWHEISNLDEIFPKMWEDNQHWLPKVFNGEIIEAIFVYEDDNSTIKHMEIES